MSINKNVFVFVEFMNYQKHYDLLIARSRNRFLTGYFEKHHVIPRCMGGTDDGVNIVHLTPEEHFWAHVILFKIYKGTPHARSLICAVNKMSRGHRGKRARNKYIYGWLKRDFSKFQSIAQTGSNNSQFGSRWANDGVKSYKFSKDQQIPPNYFPGRVKSQKKTKSKGLGKGHSLSNLKFRCNPTEILLRYESGEKTDALGKELGVSGKAIVMLLNSVFPNRRKFAPRENRSISSMAEQDFGKVQTTDRNRY